MAKVGFNRNYNINRVVRKVVYTVLALYVGGTIVNTFGDVMECTTSAFYDGLSLIGWTVSDSVLIQNNTGSIESVGGWCANPANTTLTVGSTYNNVITATDGAGVLAVVGIIGIASVVLEFITMN